MTIDNNQPKPATTPTTPDHGQEKSSSQRPTVPNAPRADRDGDRKSEPTTDSRTPSAPAGRGPAREDEDVQRAPKGIHDESPPRSDKRGSSDEQAPYFDDRPAKQRGGAASEDAPASPLPAPRIPGYGDKEPTDPRRSDVDADSGGRTPSGDRSKRS